ncbi:MAG: tRNA (N(6)-L-threonylcarbamoyladenosine(37)-C(2))-methylthiotransferase MtaB [Candidatus Promineifilaceae bacterium]
MKVYLSSIGCRLNQSEIETLGRQLLARGHEIISDPDQADQVVINTCAVTSSAARDARTQTRRIHRGNPRAQIHLTGCYATVARDELAALPGEPRVISNAQKPQLLQIMDPQAIGNSASLFDREPVLREFLHGHLGNTRAFIKVQDGCDNRCTFCITTIARGRGTSRPAGDIIAEIQSLSAAGYQEALLTGVHLGSYGRDLDNGTTLGDLLRAILTYTDIPRLRISSLEPWDIEPDFFRIWQNPRLQPHLHLPLQSGSDAILKRMARRTSRAAFRSLTEAARQVIPDLNLSTDIILGFPGESEMDFEQSMDFVRESGFSRLHAFTYSQRPGTAAAKMSDQVPPAVRKERTRLMIELGSELSLAFHRRFEGAARPVLWEQATGADQNGLKWAGYTDNYIRVTANGPVELFNTITPTKLSTARADGMSGTIA